MVSNHWGPSNPSLMEMAYPVPPREPAPNSVLLDTLLFWGAAPVHSWLGVFAPYLFLFWWITPDEIYLYWLGCWYDHRGELWSARQWKWLPLKFVWEPLTEPQRPLLPCHRLSRFPMLSSFPWLQKHILCHSQWTTSFVTITTLQVRYPYETNIKYKKVGCTQCCFWQAF